MTDGERISVAKQYLRGKYAEDLAGLQALRDQVAEGAFDSVTITGDSTDGRSSSGQLTFETLAYLKVVMDVIAEMDPTAPQEAPSVMFADFSSRQVMT